MAFNRFLRGDNEQISWKEEGTFGTAVTPTDVVGYDVRIDPAWNNSWQELTQTGADDRNISHAVGPLDLRFTLTFYPTNWEFLKYCGYDFTNTGSTPTVHTASNRNTIQSFTLEWSKRGDADVVYTLDGCSVISCTITFKKATGEGNDGFIEVSMECVAQSVGIGASETSLSAVSATPFQWRHTLFTFNNSAVVELNNGNIRIQTGVNPDDSRYCNSTLDREIGETVPKIQRVTASFNVNVLDNTYINEWNTAGVIANTSLLFQVDADNNVTFTFSNFRLATAIDPTNIDGVNNANLDGKMDSTAIVARDALTW